MGYAMSEKLRDPNLPAGATIETYEDGGALRNDGVKLKPAAQNPWYVLATVYGEQEGYFSDEKLHAMNRRIWNGWMCGRLPEEERAALAEKAGLEAADLRELNGEEKAALEEAFARRLPGVELPERGGDVALSEMHFSNAVVFDKCIFRGIADFQSSHFARAANFGFSHFARFAVFHSSHFTGHADFRSSHFAFFADFRSSHFAGSAVFWSSHFVGFADFSDGVFKSATHFEGARFRGYVPMFFQREMHQDTTFTTQPENWPELDPEKAKAGKSAYQRLALVMRDLRKPEEEHFSFGRR